MKEWDRIELGTPVSDTYLQSDMLLTALCGQVHLIRVFTVCLNIMQGTKIFQYSTCPGGQVTYNLYSSCKHMHLSFKSLCNKEHKGVICNLTSSNKSLQSTHPVGRVLWEELLILSRFHSLLRADKWNFCALSCINLHGRKNILQ